MQFSADTSAFKHLNATLNKVHKAAMPNAIRGTLNDEAYDLKTKTMPKSADDEFVNRTKTFFKANSKFIKATGFEINSMRSTVGFYENKLKNKETNYAIKDLEDQEKGGGIDGRSFIPMRQARIGGTGVTKTKYRRDNMKDFIDARKVRSISGHSAPKLLQSVRKQKLIRAAIKSSIVFGPNAYVLGNPNSAGTQTLFKVERFLKVGDKLDIKLTPLFNFSKNRKVKVQATNFMREAAEVTHKKAPMFYKKQAERQIAKYWK